MADLDHPDTYRKLDPSDMFSRIRDLPGHCRRAWDKALALELDASCWAVDKVVVLGMGGSAIGGDLLQCLVQGESPIPVFVHRDYGLPGFVDARTLIVASSYSGMTEETLSAFSQSLDTPAKKLVLATGGKLKAMAEEKGIPVFTIDYAAEPRAALAYSFIPLLATFQKLGFISDKSGDMGEMLQVLDELTWVIAPDNPQIMNPAKRLAANLSGHIAVVYGAGILAGVARRWKTQLNENGKAWAFWELFPELNHNSVVGYEFPADAASRIFVVMLHSRGLHPRIKVRYQLTNEILAKAGVKTEVVEALGRSPLSQMMSLLFIGDLVSYYLALLNDTDPAPVRVIDHLKKRLAEA